MLKKYDTLVNDIVFSLLMLTIIISPYFRGLFFRENAYYFQLVVTLLMGVLLISYWIMRKLDTKIDKKKKIYNNQITTLVRMPNRIIDFIVSGIPISYFISFFGSVDPGLARDELLRNVSYALVYSILIMTVRTRFHQAIVFNAFIVSALWISLYGYGVAIGSWEFIDAVLGATRLSSVFQYPNTLAAFVGGAFFASIIMALKTYIIPWKTRSNKTNDNQENNWLSILYSSGIAGLYTGAAMVFLSTLALTQSRAAMVVFVFVFNIGFIIVPLKDKLSYLIFAGIGALPAMYVMTKANAFMLALRQFNRDPEEFTAPVGGWEAMVVSLVAVIAIASIYGGIHQLSKQSKKLFYITQGATIVLLAIALVIAASVATEFMQENEEELQRTINRLLTVLDAEEQSSFTARAAFIDDAIIIYKDYPITGAGGGAWRVLFESYQSYSYWSTQAHIYYLQLATEVGTIGVVALVILQLSFTCITAYIYWWNRKNEQTDRNYLLLAVFLAMLMLLGHSAADFNMSYVSFAVMVWILIAIVFSELHLNDKFTDTFTHKYIGELIKPRISTLIKATIMSVGIVALITANTLPILAERNVQKAQTALVEQNLDGALNYLEAAYKRDSLDMNKAFEYASFLVQIANLQEETKKQEMQRQAIELIRSISEARPMSIQVSNQLVKTYLQSGYAINALEELDRAIELAPFSPDLYNQRFVSTYQLAEYHIINNEIEEAKKYLQDIKQLYTSYVETRSGLIEAELFNSNRRFNINRSAELSVGKVMYVTGDYEVASNLLAGARRDATIREEAENWLSAAYYKLENTEEYNKWLKSAVDRNEDNKRRVETLQNMPVINLN